LIGIEFVPLGIEKDKGWLVMPTSNNEDLGQSLNRMELGKQSFKYSKKVLLSGEAEYALEKVPAGETQAL
jgi:hypothetical protein